MWTPPVCANPPHLNIVERLLPVTLVTQKPLSRASSVSSPISSSDTDPTLEKCSQYTTQSVSLQHYPVPRVRCLSFPYQTLPSCGKTVYLYTWTLPKPEVVAKLCSLETTCFRHTDEAIGLLFSKPISKKNYVCRIPLYLTRGMTRSRIQLVSKIILNEMELERIKSAHSVISELVTNIAHLSHLGYKPSDPVLRAAFDKQNGVNDIPESLRVTVIDRFADLSFTPEKAYILSLITLIRLPACTIDYEAINALLEWSRCRTCTSSAVEDTIPPNIRPVRGILPSWRILLSQIPPEDWVGLMVKPNHLPDSDPGMFSISELCSETALSYVPTNLALKIYDTKNKEGVPQLTYFDYYTIKYQKMKDISCKINLSLPLFKSLRLTRHQNSTQVNAGLRKNKLSNKPSIFLSDACLVHPLSSWIWFLVSLIPSVLHQMSRALLTAQLFTELEVELKNPQAFSEIKIDPLIMTNNSLSSTTVFLPDRLCDPYFINGEPVKVNDFDFEVDEMTSTEEKEMDNIAQNECERNSITCPHPNYLFEPTTLLAARDAVNLERLEFYGDSFLHFIATLCVYGTSPLNADEGYLSSRRSLLVSNARLYNIARDLEWYEYCTGKIFSPPDHFLPPCYSVTSEVCKYDSRLYTRLSDKSLADMIEALLGCFLLHIGLPAAFNLLHYFQICPVDWNTIVSDKNYRIDAPWHFFLQSNLSLEQSYTNEINPSTRFLCISSAYNSLNNSKNRISIGDFEDLHQKFFPLQKKLGYYFKEIELLAEAVTHQSSSSTQIWGNYQRLEFLGDSVLGHIVTDYLFRNCLHSSPGKLSTTRSVIVSNNNLANTVVEHEIHPYIDFGACDLKVCVDEIQNIHRQTDSISERIELLTKKVTLGLNIKVLADVFESILGAVFVDSNGNTKLLSAIILRFLGKSIDCFISTLPVQPLKQLHLLHPDLRYQSSNSMSLNSNECVYELTAWTSGKRVCTTGSTRNEARLRLAEKLGISFNDEENNNSNVS